MSNRYIGRLFAALLLAAHLPASAEDLDLFVPPATDVTGRPDVLIILDNTGNWNTAFTNEMAALANVFKNLPVDQFNVGLMLFGDPQVGYVRAAIRPMTAENRRKYADMIANFHVSNDRGNARTLARTFSEAHRYLKGLSTVDAGATTGSPHNVKRDYTVNTAGNAYDDAVHALAGNALANSTATVYQSPLDPDNCYGTYIIYVGNTVPSGNVTKDNSSRNSAAGAELAAAGGNTTQMALPYTSHQDNYADEWARFLNQKMGVVTYTVDVDPTPMPGGHGNGMGNSSLIKNMADISGGKYYRVNSADDEGGKIELIFNEIFSEIQAVNSVFASVSLPLSVNTQETYLNQVYVGVFRPNEDGFPRWNGNLKQYKLALSGTSLITVDADDEPAVNSLTGFITECARSFWTPTTADDYWDFDPEGGCLGATLAETAAKKASNSPDGNIVEKGAQAYVQRASATRTMKTCTTATYNCSGGLVDFNTTNVSAADVGAGSDAERDALVAWQIGQDVDDERPDGDTTVRRPSLHGDVVHSRPVAINYGDFASPEVVVFYSGNDGVLRGINGNRSSAIGTVPAGRELWSFTPPEFFDEIKRLRANDTQYKFFGNDDVDAEPKPYGLDGSITSYVDDDDTWLFVTARRGGRVVYSFDVTDITTTPTSPTLKWKIGCPNQDDDVGCTNAAFEAMGQTWSPAKPMKTEHSSQMLIMGGGYDPCEDADPISDACLTSSKGNRVYVLNADTGAVLKSFTTDRGVAAEVFVVPDKSSAELYAKYAYVVDLGGNVYRISGPISGAGEYTPFEDSVPNDWLMTKIASLGCPARTDTCYRKFMFMPDVLEKGDVYYLMVGSGDREKPLKDYAHALSVENFFFMLKDRPTDPDWLPADECDETEGLCIDGLLAIGASDPTKSDLDSHKGWYLELEAGEKVVTSPITVFGTVTFSTHTPADPEPGSCESNLGTAKVYNVFYGNAKTRNGTANRYEVVAGGGLPPSPVAGLVWLDGMDPDAEGAEPMPFIIGADPSSSLQGRRPTAPSTTQQPKSLTYWFIEK